MSQTIILFFGVLSLIPKISSCSPAGGNSKITAGMKYKLVGIWCTEDAKKCLYLYDVSLTIRAENSNSCLCRNTFFFNKNGMGFIKHFLKRFFVKGFQIRLTFQLCGI